LVVGGVFFITLVDRFTYETAERLSENLDLTKSFFHFLLGLFVNFILLFNFVAEKLLIHGYSDFVFAACLVLLPSLTYAI